MNRKQFYKIVKQEGLTEYNIADSMTIVQVKNTFGCINDGEWIVYETDERAQCYIIARCSSEEEGLEILLNELRNKKKKEDIFKKLARKSALKNE